MSLESLGLDKHKMSDDTVWSGSFVTAVIPTCALLGVVFALFLWRRVAAIRVRGASVRSEDGREYLLEEAQTGEHEVRCQGRREGQAASFAS